MAKGLAIVLTTVLTFAMTALVLAQSPRRPAAPIGVLVGLHEWASGDTVPVPAARLRTLWIRGGESQTAVQPLGLPNLLVPRRSGFWRLGLAGYCEEEKETDFNGNVIGTNVTIADHLWAIPVGQQPEESGSPCAATDVRCVNDWTASVYWVWPEYASLEMGSRGECGAHPSWTPGYTVRSISDLDKPLSVRGVLGRSAGESARKKFDNEYALMREGEREDACEAAFDPNLWYIKRDAGAWKATGWISTPRSCGYGTDYVVDTNLSAITGRRDDGSRWQRFKAQSPSLVDTHVSPDSRWTVAVTETEVMIFAGDSTDRPLLRVPKSDHENVVMVEWATGNNVSRWNREVVRLREAGR